jgi:hypothetical protein
MGKVTASLADRRLALDPRRSALPIVLFVAGIALAAFGVLPAAMTFTAVVLPWSWRGWSVLRRCTRTSIGR